MDKQLVLSTDAVRQLIRELKGFQRVLKDDVKVDIEQAVCAEAAERLKLRIASIHDVDGNYLGTENPNASVVVEVALTGHECIWRGKQIAFVEYGTGAAGAAGAYPGVMAGGYAPDPTKKRWMYKDARTGIGTVSRGLAPQAPMYETAMPMRAGGWKGPATLVVKGWIRRAFSV